jgi:hypothetical protein
MQVKRVIDALVTSEGGDAPDWLSMDHVEPQRSKNRKRKSLEPEPFTVP